MKLPVLVSSALVALCAAATPVVSDVEVTADAQSPDVKVTYKVTEDAVVTVKLYSDGVLIPESQVTHLVGDICRKVKATSGEDVRTFHWASEMEEWPSDAARTFGKLTATVTAWATNAPPLFMVADLTVATNVTFYASKEALPGGITNEIYKTSKMLFRKIPAKEVTWNMACSPCTDNKCPDAVLHRVVFSEDYYMAVYQVTQRQNLNFYGHRGWAFTDKDDSDVRPCAGIGYSGILGSSTAMTPSASSMIGKLIAKTGIPSLNLPTEAQWEYACHALTSTMWYNGSVWANANDIAWTSSNSAIGGTVQTHPVGLKDPNAWDLYDMAGNVFEYCLDWYAAYEFEDAAVAVRDPLQKTQPSTNNRVRRGGGYANDQRYGNSAWRTNISYDSVSYDNGYRPVCAAVAY